MNFFTKIVTTIALLTSMTAFAGSGFSDKKLEAFGNAYKQVVAVNQIFKSQMQGVKSKEKAQKLQKKAQGQMIEAIQTAGLSIKEYNTIMKEVEESKELRKKIFQ